MRSVNQVNQLIDPQPCAQNTNHSSQDGLNDLCFGALIFRALQRNTCIHTQTSTQSFGCSSAPHHFCLKTGDFKSSAASLLTLCFMCMCLLASVSGVEGRKIWSNWPSLNSTYCRCLINALNHDVVRHIVTEPWFYVRLKYNINHGEWYNESNRI
jgi:hypothetical protein